MEILVIWRCCESAFPDLIYLEARTRILNPVQCVPPTCLEGAEGSWITVGSTEDSKEFSDSQNKFCTDTRKGE